MASRANPAVAAGAVAIPTLALSYALTAGTTAQHVYVHVMAGVLWTGIDRFVALVLGFGVPLPGEVRTYDEMRADDALIGAIGMLTATLSGVQGPFQLAVVLVMVRLRWGCL